MATTLKIKAENHEVEFEKEFVDKFENTLFEKFEMTIVSKLHTDFGEEDIDKIFKEHTKEEITDMLTKAYQLEIDLYTENL